MTVRIKVCFLDGCRRLQPAAYLLGVRDYKHQLLAKGREINMKKFTIIAICFLAISFLLTASADFVQAKVVKLGFIGPITGPASAQGVGLRNCFDLAIKEANKSGEFPYEIKMVAYDDASDPATAFSASLKVISDKDVVAGAGHWNSGCALAVIPGFHSAKIPYMVCAAVSPKITEYNYPEITRNCPTLSQESVPYSEWLIKEMGYKSFSVMVDTTDFGVQSLKDWEKMCEKHGAKIVSVDSFAADTTDFRPILTKIKGLNPDAIYLATPVMGGALTRKQMVKLGMKDILFTAASCLADQKFNEVAGAAAEGAVIVKPGFDLEEFSKGREFKKNYQAQGYKEPMGAYGIYAYEAAKIILQAMKEAGIDDKVALAKAIRNIKHDGVLGTTTFDQNGQTELALVTMLVSQDGKWVKWDKSKYARGEKQLPKPKK